MNSEILKAIPVLPTSDVTAGVDFYIQKLGFTEAFYHGEPISYAGVSRDGAIVHLCQMDDAKSIAAQTMLRFHVQNVETLYDELKDSGALHPNGALQTKPWGTREFTVLDLDGVCITFFENA
ncbi:MAG TPA: VOC family protein [Abditibacteriaceae bacterium]|jgi:uncharacterized glyoxalase superfamily protein PhnB